MKPVTVDVEISDSLGNLDPGKLKSAQRKVRDLVSKGVPVLVTVEQGETGKVHLKQARKYSKDVSDLKREIRRTNALLVISALRAVKVPTHTQPFDSVKEAEEFLKGKIAAAVV